jgi:nitroreductase
MTDAQMPSLSSTATLMRARRTVKAFTGQPIDRRTIESLLELALWAPTHRMTEPWRFYALDQPAVAALGRYLRGEPAICDAPDRGKAAASLAKLMERLPGAGAMVLVTWMRDPNPALDLEEHAAAAAAVQNLLLAATAAQLGTYWSTSGPFMHPLTARWCGAGMQEGVLGMIWFGHPAVKPPVPARRPLTERLRWVQGTAP